MPPKIKAVYDRSCALYTLLRPGFYDHIKFVVVAVEGGDPNLWTAYHGYVRGDDWNSNKNLCLRIIAESGDKLLEEEALKYFGNHPIVEKTYRH
jgi:hypothetical protein